MLWTFLRLDARHRRAACRVASPPDSAVRSPSGAVTPRRADPSSRLWVRSRPAHCGRGHLARGPAQGRRKPLKLKVCDQRTPRSRSNVEKFSGTISASSTRCRTSLRSTPQASRKACRVDQMEIHERIVVGERDRLRAPVKLSLMKARTWPSCRSGFRSWWVVRRRLNSGFVIDLRSAERGHLDLVAIAAGQRASVTLRTCTS